MSYIKSLFFNFLVVFFADHILPGIEVLDQTKLPHFGGDLIFSLVLGFLNSLIFPFLRLIEQHLAPVKIAMIALILNFVAYGFLRWLPVGIQVITVEGYLLCAVVVTLGSFLTNYWELKQYLQKMPPPSNGDEIKLP